MGFVAILNRLGEHGWLRMLTTKPADLSGICGFAGDSPRIRIHMAATILPKPPKGACVSVLTLGSLLCHSVGRGSYGKALCCLVVRLVSRSVSAFISW